MSAKRGKHRDTFNYKGKHRKDSKMFGNKKIKPGGMDKPQRTSGGTRGIGTGSGSGMAHPEFKSKKEIEAAFRAKLINASQANKAKQRLREQERQAASPAESMVENMTDPKKMK